MSLLIDVDLNRFANMLAADPAFYWIETTKAFILVKTLAAPEVARTGFMKGDPEKEMTFRLTWLSRRGAMQVLGFYLDGVNVIDLAPKLQTSVSSEEAVREEDKEANEHGDVEGQNAEGSEQV